MILGARNQFISIYTICETVVLFSQRFSTVKFYAISLQRYRHSASKYFAISYSASNLRKVANIRSFRSARDYDVMEII